MGGLKRSWSSCGPSFIKRRWWASLLAAPIWEGIIVLRVPTSAEGRHRNAAVCWRRVSNRLTCRRKMVLENYDRGMLFWFPHGFCRFTWRWSLSHWRKDTPSKSSLETQLVLRGDFGLATPNSDLTTQTQQGFHNGASQNAVATERAVGKPVSNGKTESHQTWNNGEKGSGKWWQQRLANLNISGQASFKSSCF